jgi:hypothetical protein
MMDSWSIPQKKARLSGKVHESVQLEYPSSYPKIQTINETCLRTVIPCGLAGIFSDGPLYLFFDPTRSCALDTAVHLPLYGPVQRQTGSPSGSDSTEALSRAS